MGDSLAVPGAPTEVGGDKPDGSRRPSVQPPCQVIAGLFSGPFFMRGLLLMAVVVAFLTRKQWTAAIGHYRQVQSVWTRDLETDSNVGPGVISFELLWMAPFLSGGGYGAEATSFILPFSKSTDIRKVRIAQHGDGVSYEYYQGMPADQAEVLQRLAMARGDVRNSVVVCHSEPGAWDPPLFQTSRCPPAGYNGSLYVIGRTMFETDRVTPHHVARINAMDEVWVPTDWAVQAFRDVGVDPAKIVKVVEPVDVDFFSPTNRNGTRKPPLPLSRGRRILGPSYEAVERPYVFLSVFKWEARKAWDVLVTAYLTQFSAADRTTLLLLTNPYHSDRNFDKKVAHLVASLGLQRPAAGWASVYILDEHVPQTALPHLYLAADAFVLPSRGEGWGRPHTEAMAMELPVITTNWSGPTEYLTEGNSYPLPYSGLVEVTEGPFKGHRWAEPSGVDLQRLMRHVYDNPEEAKAKGRQARQDMLAYAPQAVNGIVLRRLREIEAKLMGEGKLPTKERGKGKSGSSRKKEERMDL